MTQITSNWDIAAEPLVAISTEHLTPATLQMLSETNGIRCSYPNEYGGFVHCFAVIESDPPDMALARAEAKKRGFVWIKFDGDAQVIEGLPVYEHD